MTDTSREAHHTHLRNHSSKFIEQAQAVTDTSREALIKRLRTETWSGFQIMAVQAADMLEADGKAQQVAVPVAVLDAISRAGFMLVKTQSGYALLPISRIEAHHGITQGDSNARKVD